jgi:hypothetical protein
MGGFTGFDYTALPFILESKEIPRALWGKVLNTIEILTPIAMEYWNKKDD